MRKLLLLLAALLVCAPVFATGEGISECDWPGCVGGGGASNTFGPVSDPYGTSAYYQIHEYKVKQGAPWRCDSDDSVCDENADCGAGTCVKAGTAGTTPLSDTWYENQMANTVAGNPATDTALQVWEAVDPIYNEYCFNRDANTNQVVLSGVHSFCRWVEADYKNEPDTGTPGDTWIEWHQTVDPTGVGPSGELRVFEQLFNVQDRIFKTSVYGADTNMDLVADSDEYSMACGWTNHDGANGTIGCTIGANQDAQPNGGMLFVSRDAGIGEGAGETLATGTLGNAIAGIAIDREHPDTPSGVDNAFHSVTIERTPDNNQQNNLTFRDDKTSSVDQTQVWGDGSAGVLRVANYDSDANYASRGMVAGLSLMGNQVSCLLPLSGTTVSEVGLPHNLTGTLSTPAIAAGALYTSLRRMRFMTAATAGSSAGTRAGLDMVYRGDAAYRGGFTFYAEIMWPTAGATDRLFVGLADQTSVIGNVEPSTILNTIYFGYDAGGTTLDICSNGASGTATCNATGETVGTNRTYELWLNADANAPNKVRWAVDWPDGARRQKGTITTAADLPANNVMLAPQVWVNNGTTAEQVGIDLTRYCVAVAR